VTYSNGTQSVRTCVPTQSVGTRKGIHRVSQPTKRWWKVWTWFADWAWWERALFAVLALAPIVALAVGGRAQSGIAGLLAGLAFLTLQIIVYCHGGWGLLGPHFYYDVVRLARRGRSTLLRVAYIIAMFIGLTVVYEGVSSSGDVWHHNDFARVSERFAFGLFVVQNLAIFVLTPAYLGSAIAEEKERRTLELLFTTQLTNKEIILGKLFSRIIHLFGFVLAGFPILSLIQFWGGIDILVIAGNLANTLLNIVTLGSFCLLVSAQLKTVSGAVMTCYVLLLPPSFCCFASMNGFPFVLQDARWGGTGSVTVQDIGILLMAHMFLTAFFLSFPIIFLREVQTYAAGPMLSPVRRDPTLPNPGHALKLPPATAFQAEPPPLKPIARQHAPAEEPLDDLSVPYTLPPITEDALWWKERFVGGPPFVLSPVVLVPAIPFLATGVMVMLVYLFHAAAGENYGRAVELWSYVLHFLFYALLGCYVLGVAYRATGSIARERQQQTLDPLLLLPIERSELLRAKFFGCVWRGWPWLAFIGGNLLIGTVLGVYHPLSMLCLVLAVVPIIAFFAALGLLLSIVMATVMRANLIMVIVFVFFLTCTTSALFGDSPLAYLETFTFSWWTIAEVEWRRVLVAFGMMAGFTIAAWTCWWIALRCFEDRTHAGEG
jgi:ABC-type transport system involved in multi-copper enzyme maturation permease subunit